MKVDFKVYFVSALVWLSSGVHAQVVTTIPPFPIADDSVTIIFDATQGNGALAGVPPPIFAHTGVITNESTSPTDWQYVQGVWGTYDPEVLMTSVGDNLYQMKYHIRNFYGVPVDDTIYQMAFVFRNEDGSIVGREEDGSDIFVDVYEPGLNVAILAPSAAPYIVEESEIVHITAVAAEAGNLSLYINNVFVMSTTNDTIEYDYLPSAGGTHIIKVIAEDSFQVKSDSTSFFVRSPVAVETLPAGVQQGINYINDSTVTLVLYAPSKEYVFAIGDYSDWQVNEDNYMKITPDGQTYWTTLTGLNPGEEYAYQYFIDGSLKVADPLSEKVLDPWNDPYISATTYPDLKPYPTGKTSGIVSIFQTAQEEYIWAYPEFIPPQNTDLVIYELLLRDFVSTHDYNTLQDTLSYLKNLGINAIELMPVMEFEGNSSWGYNPSFFLALDKYYGTAQVFKQFIDSAHAKGIAVFLDIAMNHAFGQSPLVQMWWNSALGIPAADNPYFNEYPTHDFNVGYDFNHESDATRYLTFRVFKHWLEEYNADGYRFDLSKGYTQKNTLGNIAAWGAYDSSRIAIWKEIADTLWNAFPDARLILEHFADNSEETELANYGFMLWGNMNYNYSEASMGWTSTSNLSWGSYQSRGWEVPNLVTYMESHDEERLMYKNLTYGNSSNPLHNVKDLSVALERMELAGAFFFPIPGPKMIWQFGELGYDYSKEYGGALSEKPIRWDYLTEPDRYELYQVWSEFIKLKNTYDVFRTDDFAMDVSGAYKRINLNDDEMNVTIMGNFDVYDGSVIPVFQHTGKWYNYFSGDSIEVIDVNAVIALSPGEYRVYTDVKLEQPEIIQSAPNLNQLSSQSISAFPNPSATDFTIKYNTYHTSMIEFNIMNVSGEIVYSKDIEATKGAQSIIWNGKNEAGTKLQAGVYLGQIVTDKEIQTIKLILF